MSVERAHIPVESLIADHVAVAFKRKADESKAESTAAQIRNRITDRLQSRKPSEQDNAPPAIAALHHSIIRAFSPPQTVGSDEDRSEQLALLQTRLDEIRRRNVAMPALMKGALPIDLLLERQQLALKNEFTEGLGRVETWLVSMAVLALVLLKAIDFSWALPFLALGVGRALSLDRQCRKRRARITEIDAITGSAVRTS